MMVTMMIMMMMMMTTAMLKRSLLGPSVLVHRVRSFEALPVRDRVLPPS
jgi:hypothetical protein